MRIEDIQDERLRKQVAALYAAQPRRSLLPLPIPAADVEPDPGHAATAPARPQAHHERVVLRVHSIRHRLADADGLCAKWPIDALVDFQILKDDSPTFVKEVRFSQEKTSEAHPTEETIVSIEKAD